MTQDAISLAGEVRSARLAEDIRVLVRTLPSGGAGDDTLDLRHRLFAVLAEMT